jgi:hypothetical protein
MLESQSSILVPLLIVMVSWRPPGDVAAIVMECPVVVMLAIPRLALRTSGPYVNATAFWLSCSLDTCTKSGNASSTLSFACHTRLTPRKPLDSTGVTA